MFKSQLRLETALTGKTHTSVQSNEITAHGIALSYADHILKSICKVRDEKL